ncbi:MAG: PAS domain S-box protein [Syntrophomonadaceae bacterium]
MESKALRIMMIEDNLGDAMLIGEMLKEAKNRRFLLQHNLQLSSAFESLSHKNYDLVLLDLGLPDSCGLETLKKVLAKFPAIPVVIMTGLDDEELGFEAVKLGAQDYLIKGQIDSNLLLRTIRYSIERKRTEEIIREKEERLRATFDQAAVGIAHVRFDGSWIMVNRKFSELAGYEHPELMRLGVHEVLQQDDITFKGNASAAYSTEKKFVNKLKCSVKWAKLTFSRVSEAPGNQGYLIIVAEDITDRKELEQALKETDSPYNKKALSF